MVCICTDKRSYLLENWKTYTVDQMKSLISMYATILNGIDRRSWRPSFFENYKDMHVYTCFPYLVCIIDRIPWRPEFLTTGVSVVWHFSHELSRITNLKYIAWIAMASSDQMEKSSKTNHPDRNKQSQMECRINLDRTVVEIIC